MFGTISLNFFTDSSESDDEDTSIPSHGTEQARKFRKHPRLLLNILRNATNVLEIPEDQFLRNFRVSKEVFSILLEEITPKMPTTYRNTHIPISVKLAKFLSFVATGFTTIDHKYATTMCKSMVSKIITEMLDVFQQHLYEKWVILEQNEEEENLTKQHFYNNSGLPGIVGCVDNMHVGIKTPNKKVKDIYNNSKGFASLNVMMICDHKMVIKYVDANQPGSYADSYVWDQSTADHFFKTNYINGKGNTWLVGDSSYNLLPYLMVPYRAPTEDHQKLFNEKLYKVRSTVRHCFSVLKSRFNSLATPKGLYYSPEKAVKTVITCCILHNICIAYNSTWSPANINSEDSDGDDIESNNDKKSEISDAECPVSSSIRDEIALLATQSFYAIETDQNDEDYNDNPYNLRRSINVLDFPDDKFLRCFRVSKEVFSKLLEEILPKLKPTYRCTHTPASVKLATFLVFLATGAHQSVIEHEYTSTISKSQISRVINEMMDIFETHLYGKWIKLEQSQEEENMAKEHFYNVAGIPGVIGCVDSTHIQIKTPAKDFKDLYYNRKEFCSFNVLMICDHNMIIKYVDANQPGSYYGAYIWNQSSADNYFNTKYLREKSNTWLIGSSAYQLQPYMMIPYKHPTKEHEYKFNEKHLEIRKIIKTCFSILKDRFRCLVSTTGLQYTPEKASKIIITCCILHNMCINYKSYWPPDSGLTFEDLENDDEENIIEAPNVECAMSIRNEIASSLL